MAYFQINPKKVTDYFIAKHISYGAFAAYFFFNPKLLTNKKCPAVEGINGLPHTPEVRYKT